MNTIEFRNLVADLPAQAVSIVTVTQPELLKYHNRHKEVLAWYNGFSGVSILKSASALQKLLAKQAAAVALLMVTERGKLLPEELIPVLMGQGLENPYYKQVTRTCKRLGFVGTDYASVVNRQRCREAEEGTIPEPFNAEALWGGKGEHVTKNICRHKGTGKEYLAFLPRQKQDGDVVNSWSEYRHAATGEIIEPKELTNFWSDSDDEGRQGVEVKREWRVFALENIVEATIAGTTYSIERLAQAA